MFCYHKDRSMRTPTHIRVLAYEFQYVEIFQLLDKPVQLQASGVWLRLSEGVKGCGSKTFAGERRAEKKKDNKEDREKGKVQMREHSSSGFKAIPQLDSMLLHISHQHCKYYINCDFNYMVANCCFYLNRRVFTFLPLFLFANQSAKVMHYIMTAYTSSVQALICVMCFTV